VHNYPNISGVVGLAGRVPETYTEQIRSAGLRLAGEPLALVSPARVYVCGITPYDVTHLGHAATFVWADALQSVMRLAGVEPVTCRNVTDVDDVLTAAAGRRGRPYDEFALTQEFMFDRDMGVLGVRPPTHAPHARHHVGRVVELAAALLAARRAYSRDGFVYFRGEAAWRGTVLTEQQALQRSEEFGDTPDDPRRDSPFDVPVWRPSAPEHPAWPSPWGWGRPGWHAECAAMAWAVLGPSVDVLVGGEDLAYPHHAYQAAMIEAATSVTPFARRQVHIGAVHKDGAKMAKSTGNLVLLGDLLTRHSAAAIRLFLLHRRWHQAWEYDEADLVATAGLLEQLYAAAGTTRGKNGSTDPVVSALLDDLDVPHAVAVAAEEGGAGARLLLNALKLS
jgi:cysteinyl-tRNA synthetase